MDNTTLAYAEMCDHLDESGGELTLGAALRLVSEDYDLSLAQEQAIMERYRRERGA